MASGIPFSWPDLIQRNYEARQKYYDLIEAGVVQQPGPPATVREIEDFESWLGWQLPPSYREFLTYHNGWTCWEGDIRLLSLHEMREGPFADWIRIWKGEAWHEGVSLVIDGLIIATELEVPSGLILDTRRRDSRGEMEIVNWERGEIDRYADMVDLLQRDTADWETVLAEEPPLGEPSGEDDALSGDSDL